MRLKEQKVEAASTTGLTEDESARHEDLAEGHFRYEDYNVFYVEGGQGEPMIFLHNGGSSHRIWMDQLRHFSRNYRVYAMDNLGFGQSDKPDIDYPLELHINQLKAFIEHIGADRVILVGHCMGGAMSLNYTARHPEQVERLILCNVYTEQTLISGILAGMYRAYSSDPAVLNQAIEEAKKGSSKNDYSDDPMAQVTLLKVIARADTYDISDRVELPANMPPMLLLWGEQNPILTCESGKALSNRLKPQAFVPLANCEHMAMLEDPGSFNQAIEAFLNT